MSYKIPPNATAPGDFNVQGNGQGICPLGSIIAITTGITGAMAVPASGSRSNGWQRADGAAIAGGSTLSGTTPNLSSSIYLRGATTYGGTGGSNTTLLTTAELPAHTHGVTDSGHFHSIAHDHGAFTSDAPSTSTTSGQSATHTHSIDYPLGAAGGAGANPGANIGVQYTDNSGGITQWAQNGKQSGTNSADHTHTFSHTHQIDVPNFTGNSDTKTTGITINSTPAASSFTNEPSYVNVIYLIRVK
jgi:hypothetical protein